MSHRSTSRIGVDTGGTFTDFVVIRDGKIEMFKELSTPQRPEDAIMKGIERAGISGAAEVIHGSTVATNALLERKGASSALLTTEGFEDVLKALGCKKRRRRALALEQRICCDCRSVYDFGCPRNARSLDPLHDGVLRALRGGEFLEHFDLAVTDNDEIRKCSPCVDADSRS